MFTDERLILFIDKYYQTRLHLSAMHVSTQEPYLGMMRFTAYSLFSIVFICLQKNQKRVYKTNVKRI